MPQKTHRKLKLQPEIRISSTDRRKKKVPSLKLCGVWMEKLGFKPGDMVSVTTRDQLLIIEPPPPQVFRRALVGITAKINRGGKLRAKFTHIINILYGIREIASLSCNFACRNLKRRAQDIMFLHFITQKRMKPG